MSSNTNPYKCKFLGCDKAYPTKCSLVRHLESKHTKPKRFKCKLCQKILSSKQNLLEHKNIHNESTPYICTEPGCGESFRQRSLLCIHQKFHRKIKEKMIKDCEFKELKLTQLLPSDFIENTELFKQEDSD